MLTTFLICTAGDLGEYPTGHFNNSCGDPWRQRSAYLEGGGLNRVNDALTRQLTERAGELDGSRDTKAMT
jgi:hypothetical protein